jgi:hypothetical protein
LSSSLRSRRGAAFGRKEERENARRKAAEGLRGVRAVMSSLGGVRAVLGGLAVYGKLPGSLELGGWAGVLISISTENETLELCTRRNMDLRGLLGIFQVHPQWRISSDFTSCKCQRLDDERRLPVSGWIKSRGSGRNERISSSRESGQSAVLTALQACKPVSLQMTYDVAPGPLLLQLST